jgi:hypothetical protein
MQAMWNRRTVMWFCLPKWKAGSAIMEGESPITSYRKNASYCRVKAARTQDAEDKAKWLEFADTWEKLADKVAREGSSPEAMALDQQAEMPRRAKG